MKRGTGLSLNISEKDNSLELDLAMEVAKHFRIDDKRAKKIIGIVKNVVANWNKVAEKTGISKTERNNMARAFRQAE